MSHLKIVWSYHPILRVRLQCFAYWATRDFYVLSLCISCGHSSESQWYKSTLYAHVLVTTMSYTACRKEENFGTGEVNNMILLPKNKGRTKQPAKSLCWPAALTPSLPVTSCRCCCYNKAIVLSHKKHSFPRAVPETWIKHLCSDKVDFARILQCGVGEPSKLLISQWWRHEAFLPALVWDLATST